MKGVTEIIVRLGDNQKESLFAARRGNSVSLIHLDACFWIV